MTKTPSSAAPIGAASQTEPAAPPADMALVPLAGSLVGTVLLDRFRVLELLGEGGMAMVFLAEHVTIHKKFAIKVLRPEYASKPEFVERFLQEARAVSMIGHENVVEITDYGTAPNGSAFIVMELLDGEDLATALERDGRMPWPRARGLVLQICRALAAAHSKGIVHRDMKPENVFLVHRHGSSEFVKVLDFGIAKLLGDVGGGRSLTKTGSIFGSPEYMPPEQAESRSIDHRADIYALGVIMFELLTGQMPFTAQTYIALVNKHMYDPPPVPSQVAPDAGISPEIEAVILKALQKDRKFRFQSIGELVRAIESIGTGAGPVEVIPEDRQRPRTTGSATSYAGAHTGVEPAISEEPPRAGLLRELTSRPIIVSGGVALVVAVVLTSVFASRLSQSPPPPEHAPVTTPQLEAKAPAPEQPPPIPTVSVVLTTNVDAEVIDAASQAVLGHTNEPGGFSLDRDQTPREVLLRAEGYEPLPLRLVPNSDITASHDLVALERNDKKITRPKKKTKKATKKDPFSLLPIEG